MASKRKPAEPPPPPAAEPKWRHGLELLQFNDRLDELNRFERLVGARDYLTMAARQLASLNKGKPDELMREMAHLLRVLQEVFNKCWIGPESKLQKPAPDRAKLDKAYEAVRRCASGVQTALDLKVLGVPGWRDRGKVVAIIRDNIAGTLGSERDPKILALNISADCRCVPGAALIFPNKPPRGWKERDAAWEAAIAGLLLTNGTDDCPTLATRIVKRCAEVDGLSKNAVGNLFHRDDSVNLSRNVVRRRRPKKTAPRR